MPIRFRCVYCNQLMGIARRKAGTVVRCPNCTGQIIVPRGDTESEEPAESRPAKTDRPAFFDAMDDIDEALAADSNRGNAKPDPESAAHPIPLAPIFKESAEPASRGPQLDFPAGLPSPHVSRGIFLSPARASILGGIVVVALAVAFAAGFWIGSSRHAPSAITQESSVPAPE
jgi:hypothetical protein